MQAVFWAVDRLVRGGQMVLLYLNRFILSGIFLLRLYSAFYKRKKDKNSVNIFRKLNYCVTILLSACYKTYCFAL
ncbi:hypothetical protein CTM61_06270 [Prevotella intermedia]|nr:hypothetical protein CTM61_06270 [Prevotella intermedia]